MVDTDHLTYYHPPHILSPASHTITRLTYYHPPHILSPASHTITRLTYYYPPHLAISSSSSQVPALLTFHRNSTGCDAATLSGPQTRPCSLLRLHRSFASYVSIGRSPLPFFPLSTSSTSLHIDYPPRTRYLFLSSPRTNALPLRPRSGRGVMTLIYQTS